MKIFVALALLILSGCGNVRASGGVRVVPFTANDGAACYVLYQDEEARGVSCVQK